MAAATWRGSFQIAVGAKNLKGEVGLGGDGSAGALGGSAGVLGTPVSPGE
jgi:hypothetical protein